MTYTESFRVYDAHFTQIKKYIPLQIITSFSSYFTFKLDPKTDSDSLARKWI